MSPLERRMLDLFGRYTFRQAAGAVLLTLATLSAIVWIATALRELKILTAQGQSVLVFLKITTLALPSLMAIIAPIAVLAASIYTLNRLNGDSELIVMNASGATIWRIGRPFILLGVLVSLFVILVNVYVMPASLRMMREEITRVRADLISQVLSPGRFSSPEKGVTFHIRDRSDDGELLGLLVHDARSPNQAMTHLANHARLVKDEKSAHLIMFDGQIHQRQLDTGETRIIVYKQNVFDLSEMILKAPEVMYRPRETLHRRAVVARSRRQTLQSHARPVPRGAARAALLPALSDRFRNGRPRRAGARAYQPPEPRREHRTGDFRCCGCQIWWDRNHECCRFARMGTCFALCHTGSDDFDCGTHCGG